MSEPVEELVNAAREMLRVLIEIGGYPGNIAESLADLNREMGEANHEPQTAMLRLMNALEPFNNGGKP